MSRVFILPNTTHDIVSASWYRIFFVDLLTLIPPVFRRSIWLCYQYNCNNVKPEGSPFPQQCLYVSFAIAQGTRTTTPMYVAPTKVSPFSGESSPIRFYFVVLACVGNCSPPSFSPGDSVNSFFIILQNFRFFSSQFRTPRGATRISLAKTQTPSREKITHHRRCPPSPRTDSE